MSDSDKIKKVIKDVVERQLAPAHIVEVSVEEDVDFEGDPILRVKVVFEDERLDPEKVVGLVRHLRGPFKKLGEDRFPMFSFLNRGELDSAAA